MLRNHIMPQYYLEGFCAPDGKIFRYEKGTTNIIRTGVINAAVERGFYSDELEVELNTKIETPANPILEQIRRREPISVEGKLILAEYIVNMMKRTSEGWARTQKHAPEAVRIARIQTRAFINYSIKKYPLFRRQLERLWLAFSLYMDEWTNDFPREAWYLILKSGTNEEIVEVLSKMTWVFYISKQPNFLTSDNPVSYNKRIGIAHEEGVLSFPISSHIVLEARNKRFLGQEFHEVDQRVIDQINQRTIQGATRYIFHCEDSPSVLQLINAKN